MLGLEGAVAVLGHVHVHAHLLRAPQRLDQHQLAGLPVRTLHDEGASGVAAHDAEAEAVRPRAARGGGRRHAEERGRGLGVGRQGEVVEGHGLRRQVTGAAVHGAGVPLTLTATHRCSKYQTRCVEEVEYCGRLREDNIMDLSPWENSLTHTHTRGQMICNNILEFLHTRLRPGLIP